MLPPSPSQSSALGSLHNHITLDNVHLSCCHHQHGAHPSSLRHPESPETLGVLPTGNSPRIWPRSLVEAWRTMGFHTFFVGAKFKTLYHRFTLLYLGKALQRCILLPWIIKQENLAIMRRGALGCCCRSRSPAAGTRSRRFISRSRYRDGRLYLPRLRSCCQSSGLHGP